MASYSDDFNRGTGAIGSSWTTPSGSAGLALVSNYAIGDTDGAGCSGYYNTAIANDQWSETVVKFTPSGGWSVAPAVRVSHGPNSYYVWAPNDKLEVWKCVSGSFSLVFSNTSAVAVAGDTIRMEAEGTALRVYVNGVLKISTSDSSLSSGYAGIQGYASPYAGFVGADSWAGGDLSAAPVGQPAIKRFGGIPHVRLARHSIW